MSTKGRFKLKLKHDGIRETMFLGSDDNTIGGTQHAVFNSSIHMWGRGLIPPVAYIRFSTNNQRLKSMLN